MRDLSPHMYPTHGLSHKYYHPGCTCMTSVVKYTATRITRIYGVYQYFTDSTCLSSINQLEVQRSGLVHSTQVLHTCSVSPALPADVHLCRNRHPTTTRIYDYIPVFQHFHAVNFRQIASITELCRHQVHTGTPHIFCLTTTTIICVFV